MATTKHISVYELRTRYLENHPNGHYFDYDTLKFFGESLSTMRVLEKIVKVKDISGETHTCYVLSKLSRKYPGGARRTYDYFDINTFAPIIL